MREEISGLEHAIAQKQFRILELEEELEQGRAKDLKMQEKVTILENRIKYHYEKEIIKRGKQA